MNASQPRILVVSGNMYGSDVWDSSTARIWEGTASHVGSVHVFARSLDQRFHRCTRGAVTLHLIPRVHRRTAIFIVTSWWLFLVALRVRPDVIVSQSPVHGGLAAVTISRLVGAPVLVEVHGEHYVRPGQVGNLGHRLVFRPLTRFCLRRAQAVRSLSPQMSDALKATYGDAVDGKIVQLNNRVDLELFTPPKLQYGTSDTLRLVMAGALNDNKNQVGLVRDLISVGLPCELLLAGAGPAREEIAAAAQAGKIPVRFLGRLPQGDLAEAMRSCDVYVHYSRSEAVSRAVLEAMALGLPVVVGPGGFMDGVVQHGVNGLRLTELGPGPLGIALQDLKDPGRRKALGQDGRRYVEEHHEWSIAFRQYADFLRDLAAERAR